MTENNSKGPLGSEGPLTSLDKFLEHADSVKKELEEVTEDHSSFITVYKPISGWKAIMYWWNPDMGGFWEPWQTGMCTYRTKEEAEQEAEYWAEAEEVRYVKSSESPA